MENIKLMQGIQPLYNLNENSPNLCFCKQLLFFMFLLNFMFKVTVIGKLHNNAKNYERIYHRDFVD